jgi:uncharacterized protein YjdB
MSGTSQATPVVSGVAALVLTSYGIDMNNDGSLDILDFVALEKHLKATATRTTSLQIGGVVNAQKALQNVVTVPRISLAVNGDSSWNPLTPFLSGDGVVTITSSELETIYYTLNGTTPTAATGRVYDGPFTLTGTGSVAVKAVSVNGMGKVSTIASAIYKLNQPVESIEIVGSNTVAILKSTLLKALVQPSYATNKAVTWSIPDAGDRTLASISLTGLFTAKNMPGTVTVRADAKDGSGTFAIFDVNIVGRTVYSITMSPLKAVMKVGDPALLVVPTVLDTAKALYADAPLVWTTSNAKVASVTQDGYVTALSKGTASITCAASDGSLKKAICYVTVTVDPVEVQITGLDKINPGRSTVLKATVLPIDATNKTVSWSIVSGDATVNSYGTVTARPTASGTIVVKAASNAVPGVYGTFTITVFAGRVTYISIPAAKTLFNTAVNNSDYDFYAGEDVDETTVTLYPILSGTAGFSAELAWTSSAPKIASVDQSGNVTALAVGSATITAAATDGSGVRDTCIVKVIIPASRLTVTTKAPLMKYNNPTLCTGKSASFTATLGSTYGIPTNKAVKWSVWYVPYDEYEDPIIEERIMKYVTITQTGTLTVASGLSSDPYFGGHALLYVEAMAKDGSGVYDGMYVDVVRPTTYLTFVNAYGYKITGATAWLSDEIVVCEIYGNCAYDDYSLTSSNPKVAGALRLDYDEYGTLYAVIKLEGLGSATIKVMANDGTGKYATLNLIVK